MNNADPKLSRIEEVLPLLKKLYSPCKLCRHECGAEREKGKTGICRAPARTAVYSYSPHHGEEPPISGSAGSGTIFFTHCNMKCVYCQNYSFSQESDYEEISTEHLAERMLELEGLGCHNINLVSPTHYACQIVTALKEAIQRSLKVPVVYNTGGYDSLELIELLDGIVDIYMPDMRYADNGMAARYSGAPHYADNSRLIIKEMFRQVGNLKIDKKGVARKGVIVRLLILPGNVSGTIDTLRFLKKDVSNDIFLSVMSQYHPTYKAHNYPDIARRITEEEYHEVIAEVERLGFTNGWIQGYLTESEHFLGTRIKKGRFNW